MILVKNIKIISLIIVLSLLGCAVTISSKGIETNKETKIFESNNLFNDEQFFDRYISLMLKIGRVPSLSACIIKNGTVVWAKGYGFYDIENKKPASPDTIYLLGSTTKAMSATAIMQLYEKGKLSLDDDVNKYLDFTLRHPKYPDTPITIKMLLNHSSGLIQIKFPELAVMPDSFHNLSGAYNWIKEWFILGGRFYSPGVTWGESSPGEKFHYSNMNYILLAYILENITKQPFNVYCQEHIFKPLGMNNTSYDLRDLDVDKIAIPYVLSSSYIAIYQSLQHYSTYFFPADDLRTTVNDLSHFLIAHMNGGIYNGVRILNESTVKLMHTIQTPDREGWKYCLGWMVWEMPNNENYSGHIGAGWGYYSCMKIRNSDNSAVIYFTNRGLEDIRSGLAIPLIELALFKKAKGI